MRKTLLFFVTLLTCFIFCVPVFADDTLVTTTANVNVRSGPGTGYEILTTCPEGTQFVPEAKIVDGWRQVQYGNGYGWIFSYYLSAPETVADTDVFSDDIEEISGNYENLVYENESEDYEVYNSYSNYGTDGRLIIPDLGIDVALNYCNPDEDEAYAQYVVDCQDSACYCYRNNTIVIGDHRHQGFSGLYDAYIGAKAYILHADGSVINLVCERITEHGYNDDYMYDEYGNKASLCSQPFIAYTCNPGGGGDVTITYWNYA